MCINMFERSGARFEDFNRNSSNRELIRALLCTASPGSVATTVSDQQNGGSPIVQYSHPLELQTPSATPSKKKEANFTLGSAYLDKSSVFKSQEDSLAVIWLIFWENFTISVEGAAKQKGWGTDSYEVRENRDFWFLGNVSAVHPFAPALLCRRLSQKQPGTAVLEVNDVLAIDCGTQVHAMELARMNRLLQDLGQAVAKDPSIALHPDITNFTDRVVELLSKSWAPTNVRKDPAFEQRVLGPSHSLRVW